MNRTTAGVILLVTLLPLACDGSGTAPLSEIVSSAQNVHGLELSLSVDPAATVSGGNFTAIFTVTNRREVAVTLISGCTQLARGAVYRAGDAEPQWFIGATGGCYLATSQYRLDVGETFEQVWNVTAASHNYLGDLGFETVLATKGDYLFRVSPDVYLIDQAAARLRELDVTFRVN